MKISFIVSIDSNMRETLSKKTRHLFGSSCVLIHNNAHNMVQIEVYSGDEASTERVVSSFNIFKKWCEHKGIIIV